MRKVLTTIYLDVQQLTTLRHHRATTGISASETTRTALTEYFKRHKKRSDRKVSRGGFMNETGQAQVSKINCHACRYSYMEPDSDLICGHPESGVFGKALTRGRPPHCGEFTKFEQHPLRHPDGSLKSLTAFGKRSR